MVRLVGESGSGRQFNESELRRIAEGQWYYSIELLPGVVAGGQDIHFGVPMLPRILMRGCDLSGMDCLDLGSMEGLIPVLMKRGGAQTVLATDFNGWLIEKLDAVRYAYDAEFEFRSLGLMYDIHKKLGGRSFDFINCSGLLYHTWSPLQVLAGIRPILRRGGYMLVSTYVSFEEGDFQKFNSGGRLVTDCNTFWYMSVELLDYTLRYLGLIPVDIAYIRSDQLPEAEGYPPPDGMTGYISVLCQGTDDPLADAWMLSSSSGSIEYKHGADWGLARSQPYSKMRRPAVRRDLAGRTLIDAIREFEPTSRVVPLDQTTFLSLGDQQ
jgi:2-polyprenyl-3-methyl-5-hydroxy-6-metoxy-1,4-benzoquinol methylase